MRACEQACQQRWHGRERPAFLRALLCSPSALAAPQWRDGSRRDKQDGKARRPASASAGSRTRQRPVHTTPISHAPRRAGGTTASANRSERGSRRNPEFTSKVNTANPATPASSPGQRSPTRGTIASRPPPLTAAGSSQNSQYSHVCAFCRLCSAGARRRGETRARSSRQTGRWTRPNPTVPATLGSSTSASMFSGVVS